MSWRFFLSLAALASVFELGIVLFHTSRMHQENLASEMAGLKPYKDENPAKALMPSSQLAASQRTLGASSTVETTGWDNRYYKPRILVGILADSQTEESKEMRNRFRQMFHLWNDTRVCSLNEFTAKEWDDQAYYMDFNKYDAAYDCQIVYTFVLGAFSDNETMPHFVPEETVPKVRLHETPDEPLILEDGPVVKTVMGMPFSDVIHSKDGIFLNIVENMNNGKTATYLHWASKISRQFKIPYVAKCDTDTVIRLQQMLAYLHQELPRTPARGSNPAVARPQHVVSGSIRHKPWKGGFLPTVDESFWQEQYFHGMHLYLNGGFYLMSQHLSELAVEEARKLEHIIPHVKMNLPKRVYNDPHAYLEGAEDHDAIALIEHGLFNSLEYKEGIMQWVIMPKDLKFFSHPVKNHKKFERFIKTEQKRKNKSPDEVIVSDLQVLAEPPKTLLVIFNATTASMREEYRSKLQGQGHQACNALQEQISPVPCDLYYFFVVGDTSTGTPVEQDTQHLQDAAKAHRVGKQDVLFMDVDNENQLAMGLAAMNYIQVHLEGYKHSNFSLTIFCQSSRMVNIKSWYDTVVSSVEGSLKMQSNHHLLIGDVRDKTKGRKDREYQEFCDYDFFRSQHDVVQLYLGSECLAFSTNLIPYLLRESQHSTNNACRVGDIGHDLSYLAYKSTDIILHWMPIPKSLQFWHWVEIGSPAWEPDLITNSGSVNLPIASPESDFDPGTGMNGQVFLKPRILVGIVTDSITLDAQALRNRHRQLFEFWNDPRLCSLKDFRSRNWEQASFFTESNDRGRSYDCQVVYSFILAAHQENGGSSSYKSNATTLKLYDTPDDPLVLKTIPLSKDATMDSIPYADVLEKGDGTFLNIIENMNQGKTATFLYWASQVSERWNIPYVAKCDSDSFLNLTTFLEFLHDDLPKIPKTGSNGGLFKKPSVLAGSPMLRKQRDPDWWLTSTDESFWENEYFLGSHLYYNGGFYLMSRDLAEESTNESRRLEHHIRRIVNHETRKKKKMKLWEDKPHEYLEGTEDVDAFGTAEQGHYRMMGKQKKEPSVIDWIHIPHESVFHLHPVKVKNKLKWKALWSRENRLKKERGEVSPRGRKLLDQSDSLDDQQASKVKTLIVIYGATTHSEREKYRAGLYAQGKRICSGLQPLSHFKQDSSSNECGIHYFFVVGRDDDGKDIPTENIHNASSLVWPGSDKSAAKAGEDGDVLVLNVQGSNAEGLGLSTLFYIQEHLQGSAKDVHYDLLMFAKASHMINIQQWLNNIVSTAQYSVGNGQQTHLLIGDVRDKGKNKREFINTVCENPLGAFKYHKHHSPHQMQLYLGSDCFAFSSSLVSLWLDQARNPDVGRCTEGQLGHDLTYLSHFSGAILHWMRVPKTLHFWSKL
jgi:Galactosyltransferase